MAETQETEKTKQAEVKSQNAAAKQEQEKILDQLLETAKPDVNEHKRRLCWLLIPVVLVVIQFVIARINWGEWQPTFELGAVTLTAFGTIVIALGGLPKPRTAALMSTTLPDGNRYLLAELLKNRIAAWAGLILILLGFLCQMAVFALQRLTIE